MTNKTVMRFWPKGILINLLVFLVGTAGLWFLHEWVLFGHLNYGFRDVDWWSLVNFEIFNSSPLEQFLNLWKLHGVYTYQPYFIGVLVHFLGLNFYSLNMADHIFKFLASISVFPLVYLISKSKLISVLSMLIYAVSYSSIGALSLVVTSGYYVGIIFMNVFFIIYWYGIVKDKSLKWFLFVSIVFLFTLIVNTERMYTLIPLLVSGEVVLIWKTNWSKEAIYKSLLRLFIVFLPLLVLLAVYATSYTFFRSSMNSGFFIQGFVGTAGIRIHYLQYHNWQLLIYPFASLGSLFLLNDYWKIFGVLDLTSFNHFLIYLVTKPLLLLYLPTLALMFCISKKPFRWTALVLSLELAFYLIEFWLYKNWLLIDKNIRIHFDPNLLITPAAFGFYICILSSFVFLRWFREKKMENFLLVIWIGSVTAFIIIFSTWIFSDVQLIFMGTQRYLTIPAIGSSMFIAGIIALFYNRLKKLQLTRAVAPLVLLAVIPIIRMDIDISRNFFSYELNYAGMDGVEQTRMKNEFWSHVPNMSNTGRSLFYFDETADKDNGYFDESTIIAGLDSWVLFDHGKDVIKGRPEPGILRTNVQCPKISHESCIEFMKSGLNKVNGEEGILYADPIRYPDNPRFYKLKNFYAFRFINKHLVDIKEEVLKEIGIN